LVEGDSDRLAVEALAEKLGRDLDAEGVTVVPMHGASKATTYIELFGPNGFQLNIAGLCDDAEERYFARGLERAGIVGPGASRADYEAAGFFACVNDIEEELIRALGATVVTQVIFAAGDASDLQNFQTQSAWTGKTLEEQLRGFLHRRNVQYMPLLVDALPAGVVPSPLSGVLAHV
jgi:hypothetical protein